MKKVLSLVALVMISVIIYAFNDEGAKVNQESKNEVKDSEVVVMDKDMFIKDVFDYQTSQEWKYKGRPVLRPARGPHAVFRVFPLSIPLFVFIPMKGEPQLFRGAADKATYKKAIDEFLLK